MSASTATTVSRKSKKDKKHKGEFMVDLFERFNTKEPKLYELPKTNRKVKKNLFTLYRPKPGHCLDYNISQTDAKLDAGITKINIQQTRATYVPVPPEEIPEEKPVKRKRIKYSHAGPPVWEFLDEKWKRKQEALQVQYRAALKKRLRKAKLDAKNQFKQLQDNVLTKVGPEWFQELSPNQLKTVENLKKCLEKDVQDKTIINTKENIGNLGLVLRPNSKKIERAIKLCRCCPVEFLLVLYQLLEPKRTKYSINDRLLLSAVVHLTMVETLREMHVRIPSPPRKVKPKVETLVRKQPKKAYVSPYLEPYTYVKPPRKFTGIYRDKHLQYPESSYFSYLPLYRLEVAAAQRISKDEKEAFSSDRREREIISEIKLAQKLYNTIHKEKSRFLIKPRVFVPCKEVNQLKKLTYPAARKKIYHIPDDTVPIIPVHLSVEVTVTSEYNEADELIDKRCTFNIEYTENPEEFKTQIEQDRENVDEKTCECCSQGVKKIKSSSRKLGTCSCRDVGEQSQKVSTCDFSSQTYYEDPPDYRRKVDKKQEEPRKEITTIQSTCSCKEEAMRQLEATKCRCETCIEYRRQQEVQYIISGITQTSSGEIIPIISAVIGEKVCDCMEKYKEKIEKVEDYRRRIKARQELKADPNQYVIGGVINRPEGPVYIISGVKPFGECKCAKSIKEEMEEQERLAAMPQPPKGRVIYGISGVRKTSQGHVYILTEALPIEECMCEKLYNKFVEKHGDCMKMYEDYIKQIKEDINEHMLEMERASRRDLRRSLDASRSQVGIQEDTHSELPVSEVESYEKFERGLECGGYESNAGGNVTASYPISQEIIPEASMTDDIPLAESTRVENIENPFVTSVPIGENLKVECDENNAAFKTEQGDETAEEKGEKEKSVSEGDEGDDFESEMDLQITVENARDEMMELKRFTILKKIPCNEKEYKRIIRKTLKVMAEDGYPLAKLPNSHMLPHFRLWMQMRCGMFWDRNDRFKYVEKSILEWREINKLYKSITEPRLPFSEERGRQFTWREFKVVNRMVEAIKTNAYRNIRQNQIDFGRAFFPTLYQYEFPSKYFRDCYFAYTPSKEEDSVVYNIWQSHEVKNFRKRKSCLCKR